MVDKNYFRVSKVDNIVDTINNVRRHLGIDLGSRY